MRVLAMILAFSLPAPTVAAAALCVEHLTPEVGDVSTHDTPQVGEMRETVVDVIETGASVEITYEMLHVDSGARSTRQMIIDHDLKEAAVVDEVNGAMMTQSYPYEFATRHCYEKGVAAVSEQVLEMGGMTMTLIYRQTWLGPDSAGGQRFGFETLAVIPGMPEQPPVTTQRTIKPSPRVLLTTE